MGFGKKNLNKVIGVYKIENILNGKIYIGGSNNLKSRVLTHKTRLRENTHHNKHLQNSWNKYGKENFKFETIEECGVYELEEREQYWFSFYKKTNIMFNARPVVNSNLGIKHSEEHINNWRKSRIGFKFSKAVIEKMKEKNSGSGNGMYGKHHTEETKQKMSKVRLGKKLTEEHKHKISRSLIALPEEIRTKINMSHKRNKGRTGQKQSKEEIEKRRAKTVGIKRTEEVKQKIRDRVKNRSRDKYGKFI